MPITEVTTVEVTLAQRIRDGRKRLGMTQVTLAYLVDLPPDSIRAIEHSRRRVSVTELAELAFALRTTTDRLLGVDKPCPNCGHVDA